MIHFDEYFSNGLKPPTSLLYPRSSKPTGDGGSIHGSDCRLWHSRLLRRNPTAHGTFCWGNGAKIDIVSWMWRPRLFTVSWYDMFVKVTLARNKYTKKKEHIDLKPFLHSLLRCIHVLTTFDFYWQTGHHWFFEAHRPLGQQRMAVEWGAEDHLIKRCFKELELLSSFIWLFYCFSMF